MPNIRRTINISADNNAIYIDGEAIDYSQLVDVEGKACTPNNIHNGSWYLNYYGAELNLYFGTDIATFTDMAEQINASSNSKFIYTWQTGYVGNVEEQAVDADIINRTKVTDALAEKLKNWGSYQWKMKADDTGIWMEDADGIIKDSKRTWEEMFIKSWDQGTDISDDKLYSYNMDNGEISFSFDFTLSDITSRDSVIDGINDMLVSDRGVNTSYTMDVVPGSDSNIKKATAKVWGLSIDFMDEVALGRIFGNQTDTVASENVTVAQGSKNAELHYKDSAGNDVLAFQGDITPAEQVMKDAVDKYLDFVLRQKMAAALAGKDPQDFEFWSLDDLVGAGNITKSGYLDDVVTLQPDMKLTTGGNVGGAGTVGSDYPCAYIDFANITDLSLLEELGFNSTCKTCDNHYSIVFRSGNYNNVTNSGFRYNMERQGDNYMLEIDIDSLINNGVTGGQSLAEALVEITDAAYDFHYTQYASEGSKLYIYDNRTQSEGTTDATFDTKPYPSIDECEFNLSMKSDRGASVDLDYTYNFKDVSENVCVEMQKDANGDYILNADGTYEKWDGTGTPDRYSMSITYKDEKGNVLSDSVDAEGNPLTARQQAVESYSQNAVREVVTSTKVDLEATDYSYLNLTGDENANTAIRPKFDSQVLLQGAETGIRIQHSAASGDFTIIPRFGINTHVLGLSRAGCKTIEQAEQTINDIKYAGRYVAEKRALYGAYQNRLEHTYRNNRNIEENMEAAESRIRDTDIAEEAVKNANLNILLQAGVSMLSQANQQPNYALSLLQ